MESIYWIGIKESDLADVENIFRKSITFFGNNTESNSSYSATSGQRINHNLENKNVNSFIAQSIENTLEKDNDAHFIYYSPYHSYYLPEKFSSQVYCQNEKNVLEMLRSKITTRFWLSTIIPIIPSTLINSSKCTYQEISSLFPGKVENYVIQKNYSAGGYSTFLLGKADKLEFEQKTMLMVSPYISNCISLNVTVIIYEQEIVLLPASIQIIVEDNKRLLYKGADFIAYETLDMELQYKTRLYSEKICENLRNLGYLGICGIDFITDGKEVYFMEVNERFQASSALINIALKERGLASLQKMNIEAFTLPRCSSDLSNFRVNYSNYIYTYHECYKQCYQYIFEKAQNNKNVYRIVEDNFIESNYYENDAYLFALIFKINITSINFDGGINIDDHIKEHVQLSPTDILKVKINLMNQGFSLTSSAKRYLKNSGGTRTSINNGLDLILFDTLRINGVCNETRLLGLSPFQVQYDTESGLILTHYGKIISKVKYDFPDPLCNKQTKNGVPYSAIAFFANERLQINHEPVCFYKKHGISCKFCGLSIDEIFFEEEDVYEVIDCYLNTIKFKSFLIGGASNIYTDGWEIIIKIARYISSHSSKPIYLMSPPPPQKEILYQLKEAGITEIAFNIEMFDRSVAKLLMPGKGRIPLNLYRSMLEEAVKIWGENGHVRSILVVGLENKNSLLDGVKYLAQHGIQPILSPFGPRPDTELKDIIPLSSEELVQIFYNVRDICQPYRLKPGPDNEECQNNTLSIPDRYMT